MPWDDEDDPYNASESQSWPDTSRPVIGHGPSGSYSESGYPYEQGYGQAGYDPGGYQGGYQQTPGPSAVLYVDDDSHRAYTLRLGGNIIGRGQDADFRLPEPAVSRRHVEITWDGRNAILADLGSTNGTTVNGTPVQTWQLTDGDVLRIGRVTLVFRFEA